MVLGVIFSDFLFLFLGLPCEDIVGSTPLRTILTLGIKLLFTTVYTLGVEPTCQSSSEDVSAIVTAGARGGGGTEYCQYPGGIGG